MNNVKEVIAKLAAAGAVTVQDKEPKFTEAFVDYVSFSITKIPEREQSLQAWQNLITGFDRSLASLSLEELLATLSLACSYVALDAVPMQKAGP